MLTLLAVAGLIFAQDASSASPIETVPKVWTGVQVEWASVPRPDRHLRLDDLPPGASYLANFRCKIERRGRLSDCALLSERANTIDFSRAAERGIRNARIKLGPDGPQIGDQLAFSVTMIVHDD